MKKLIENGTYKKDERLPSIREFAESFHVSANTARAVYESLERARFVRAVPQSGFYVDERVSVPSLSVIDARSLDPEDVGLYRVAAAMATAGGTKAESIDLGLAYLARDLIPADALRQFADYALRNHRNMIFPTLLSPGYDPLRRQIAMHALSMGVPVQPEDLILTSGCQESIYLALTVVAMPGSYIAVENPVSFEILKVLEALRLKPVEIPCFSDEGMSLEALSFALDRDPIAAVVTNGNFLNPTGAVMPAGRKEALTRMLAARDIPLIEDDACGDLFFAPGASRPSTCLSFDRGGGVIYCSSFSKTVSPNLRLGWIIPGKWLHQVERHTQLLNHGMSPIPQISMALLLEDGLLPRHLRKVRTALRSRVPVAREAILSSFPEGTQVSDPSGGVSLWVTLPEGKRSRDLYDRALAQGILVAPGRLFGVKRRNESSFRVNASVLTSSDAGALGSIARDLSVGEESGKTD